MSASLVRVERYLSICSPNANKLRFNRDLSSIFKCCHSQHNRETSLSSAWNHNGHQRRNYPAPARIPVMVAQLSRWRSARFIKIQQKAGLLWLPLEVYHFVLLCCYAMTMWDLCLCCNLSWWRWFPILNKTNCTWIHELSWCRSPGKLIFGEMNDQSCIAS